MDETPEVRINGEVLRRARVARNLSQRALAHDAHLRLGQLVAMEASGRCERMTLGALYKLADRVCVEPASLLTQQTPVREPQPDDVIVEAMLAMVAKAISRDDIAWALGWDLERVNHALLALELRLRSTGQRLRRAKFGWFGLAAADDVLAVEHATNIERATFSEYGITRSHALVLYDLARGKRLNRAHSGRQVDHPTRAHNPYGDLLRGGLLGVSERGIFLTPEVAFSLCLDGAETAPACALKPRPAVPAAAATRSPAANDSRASRAQAQRSGGP